MARKRVTFDQLVNAIDSDPASARRHLTQVIEANEIRLREIPNATPRERASWERENARSREKLAALDRGEKVSIFG